MLTIQDSGIEQHNGNMQYVWFRVQQDGVAFFRAVALVELASVPISIREDYDLLGKQVAAVRGLYNAKADFVYSAAGIYTPEHVGVVQFYGGAGMADSRDEAAGLALRNLAAVRATLANFEQARLEAPHMRWVEWYVDFITRRAPHVTVLIGHPDPRNTRRGLRQDGEAPNDTGDDLAPEQNELLFRGLAKLREDFVFQVTAERVSRAQLSRDKVRVEQVTSAIASRQRGSKSIAFSASIPWAFSLAQAASASRSTAASTAHSQADGASHGWGNSHTDSTGHSVSDTSTVGGSETTTEGNSHAAGRSHTDSEGWGTSETHTTSSSSSTSHAHTDSSGGSSGWSTSASVNQPAPTHTEGSSSGVTDYGSRADAEASLGVGGNPDFAAPPDTASSAPPEGVGSVSLPAGSTTSGHTDSAGGSVSAGFGGTGASVNAGVADTHSVSAPTGPTTSANYGTVESQGQSSSDSAPTGLGWSVTSGASGGSTWGSSDTTTTSHSSGSAHSSGSSHSTGVADGKSETDTQSASRSVSHSWATSHGETNSTGTADGKSESWGKSHSEGDTQGRSQGQAVGSSFGLGHSAGIVPGISAGRSWQTEDHVAMGLTRLLMLFEAQLEAAAAEGAFMSDAVIFTASSAGQSAARALVPQAFHGPNVPTPILTIQPEGDEAQDIRDHAAAFLHYRGADDEDPLGGIFFTKGSTLHTTAQLAALVAPGIFEEGTAMTVMAPIPRGVAFYPNLPGDVVLGHQVSPETADLTTTPVRLNPERLMHTLFAGDTGWGKSVAAIQLAYETTLKWRTRTVVLDFGAGWRQLLNAPGLQGHVDVLQLWPDAVRPLRWNPLQIGRQINPETQWRAFADIFGSIARLGVKRQKQELLDALRHVYLAAGVLVDDPEIRAHQMWGRVQPGEDSVTGATVGYPLGDLTPAERQLLAVHRSSVVGLSDLNQTVEAKRKGLKANDTMLQGVLDGIIYRMHPLVQGGAAAQFAAGPDATPLEDLSRPWGVTVIEGGSFLDDFCKAFLLGWAGWHLYTDMVARRVHGLTAEEPVLQIFFEEANKIFGGLDTGGDDESGGVSASQRFGDMFRDARKYKCFLHVVTQAPSLIVPDVISSCNNLVLGFLKNPKDKDLALSALAQSEKGFRNEDWRRFVTNLPIGWAIGRFPYTTQRERQQPFLFKPLMLSVPEPTDADIQAALGDSRKNGIGQSHH